MAPAEIPQILLDTLLTVLSGEDRAVVTNLYQLDENPLKPTYVLRPVDPAQRKAWRTSEQRLQVILRRASDLCLQAKTISENDRNEFHISGKTINDRSFAKYFFSSHRKRNLSCIDAECGSTTEDGRFLSRH